MSLVYLIRHCETSGQEPEASLTETGRLQAIQLAQALKGIPFRRIVSSSYQRAIQSAQPLAAMCGLEIELDPRLRERNLGNVNSDDWLGALSCTFDDENLVYQNGESTLAATNRAMESVSEIIERCPNAVAIFTHGNLLSLIARAFDKKLGFEFWRSLKNPDVFQILSEKNCRSIKRVAL